MSTLPSPAEVAGVHVSVYESYYNVVDPKHHGQVGAMEAAKFLKKSHLSDIILSKIWDLADPDSHGFLDKRGMFVALKLCALAQQGHNLSISNIYMDIAPPKMGDVLITNKPLPCPQSSSSVTTIKDNWSISTLEKAKYEQLFYSLEPINGFIPGNKVKGVLMDSKLPLETLGKIWDLADIDKDGKLDLHEFTIAMHLVYKALEKHAVPTVLPSELLRSTSNEKDILLKSETLPSSMPVSLSSNIDSNSITKETISKEQWVVSHEDKMNSDKLFVQADEDLDGFVSGAEIKDIFFQSGLAQPLLAQIWSLCDFSQNGKLNNEQFALAMWLIKQKLQGIELPTQLTPEMIPPSFRKKTVQTVSENNNLCSFSNPELDMISKDIMEMIHERHILEQDISQKEADIKIKNGEIKSLQSELDTLAATLRQLDNQKGEAQKRLNDLQSQVDKLRQQAADQESNLHTHEDELNTKRQAIECLKLAEQKLETQQHSYNKNLTSLSQQLQSIQLRISQTKANMSQLEEQQRQIVDAITQYDAAFAVGNPSVVPDATYMFRIKLDRATYALKENINTTNKDQNSQVDNKDLFNNNDKMEDVNHFTSTNNRFDNKENNDSFQTTFHTADIKDPFGDDPFAALHAPTRSESPSPALPPKKSKQPPPRPAPPRPSQSQQVLSQPSMVSGSASTVSSSDPFADKSMLFNNSTSDVFEFADFANFDSK